MLRFDANLLLECLFPTIICFALIEWSDDVFC